MIRYELKKVINVKSLLCVLLINILFVAVFWIQVRGVRQAESTGKLQSIYHKIGGEITAEKAQQIEALKQQMDEILGKEGEIEQKYIKGKISVDEYMKYRDEFHYMQNRSEEINMVYERYQVNKKNGSWMIFARYYEQLFQPSRNQWGLLLSVFVTMLLLVCCETQEMNAVTAVTKKGRKGIWREKLNTILVISLIVTILYALEEAVVVSGFFPFQYLEAPVQSISCLSGVKLSLTIGQWWLMTFFLRLVNTGLAAVMGCAVLLRVKNRKSGILLMAFVVFVPMILAKTAGWDACNVVSKWITVYSLFV